MRLIDATQVDFSAYIDPYEIPGAEECLANMPSVEAIPIEWLEQLLDDAELAGQPYTINILKRILNRWEEENEKD